MLRVERSGYGASIGTVFCGVPTCADDMLFISDDPDELQLMLDMGFDYSSMENYLLQPVKSGIVVAEANKRKQYNWQRMEFRRSTYASGHMYFSYGDTKITSEI